MTKKNQRGVLITLEGTEGSGKTTLIRNLALRLEQAGAPVIQTREPGGSPLAERIRELVLKIPMSSRTELFLYEAARSEHLAYLIRPALTEGKIVLCDRFTDSTLAYQAGARGLPWKEVQTLNKIATAGIEPDLTILVDIDPAVGLERARDPNRFEAEGIGFQKKVRSGYLRAKRENPKRWFILKAQNRTPEELTAMAYREIEKRFGKRFGKMKSHRNS